MQRLFKIFGISIFLLFIFVQRICAAEASQPDLSKIKDHPRIFMSGFDFGELKERLSENPELAKIHRNLIAGADETLKSPLASYEMTGRRLLSVSRQEFRRAIFLSYAYLFTKDKRYLNRAEEEIKAICEMPSWNPSHFLDTAEMTAALSIFYDWLYKDLSADTKKLCATAIAQKGLEASKSSKYNWFLRSSNNWNAVCNLGMLLGSLAIYDENPELAKEIIERGRQSIKKHLACYAPDGVYPEGYNYWDYGSTFQAMYIMAMESAFKSDFGLANSTGFLESARWHRQMEGPSGFNFSFSDTGTRVFLSPAVFWFAKKLEDASVINADSLVYSLRKNSSPNSFLIFALLYASDLDFKNIPSPKENSFFGRGATPVFIARSDWGGNAQYFAIKGGKASENHGHMDVSSFVYDALGERWVCDLGMQNYNSLESKGLKIWSGANSESSDRWKVFRYNNHSHNVISIDGKLHDPRAYVELEKLNGGGKLGARADITALYSKALKSCVREAYFDADKNFKVFDKITSGEGEHTLRWSICTDAKVAIKSNSAILEKRGKRLEIFFESNLRVELKTWSAEQDNDYDAPNKGFVMLGFEAPLPKNSESFIKVKFKPKK